MLFLETPLLPRAISFDPSASQVTKQYAILTKRDTDRGLAASIAAITQIWELTECSPVIPHEDVVRIHDNVLAQHRVLSNMYSSIGGSLDAQSLMAQFYAVWDAAENHASFCVYQTDGGLVDELVSYINDANTIMTNAGNVYGNNFANAFAPMRSAYQRLQTAASSASNDIGPSVDAYYAFWQGNFQFALYPGMSGYLDGLLSEYKSLTSNSRLLFDQADARVQANFETEFNNYNYIYSQLLAAYKTWDEDDGAAGYSQYVTTMEMPFLQSSRALSNFVVVERPVNDQIFGEIKIIYTDVKKKWDSFPTYVHCFATQGFILDPNTSAERFYARQLVLNVAQAAGARFFSTISPGESLIGTGFSYQHGGRMKPHKEHKDGKDCDLFSVRFRLNETTFDRKKTVNTIAYLLSAKATRVIFSDATTVKESNAAVQGNAVAVNLPGHDTHIHFDMDMAT